METRVHVVGETGRSESSTKPRNICSPARFGPGLRASPSIQRVSLKPVRFCDLPSMILTIGIRAAPPRPGRCRPVSHELPGQGEQQCSSLPREGIGFLANSVLAPSGVGVARTRPLAPQGAALP